MPSVRCEDESGFTMLLGSLSKAKELAEGGAAVMLCPPCESREMNGYVQPVSDSATAPARRFDLRARFQVRIEVPVIAREVKFSGHCNARRRAMVTGKKSEGTLVQGSLPGVVEVVLHVVKRRS